MDILLVSKFSFLLFACSFLIHQVPIVVSGSVYNPTDPIFLSCGTSGDSSDDGRQWIGDMNSNYSLLEPISVNKSMVAAADKQPPSSLSIFPYKRARVSHSRFTYTFDLPPGPKFVRLYFFPTTYRVSGKSFTETKGFMDVTAGPYTLLRNFSALLAADRVTDTFTNEYCIFVQENQKLNITFSSFLGDSTDTYAFINAIEIVSMPNYLYYTMPNSSGITIVRENEQFHIPNGTALHTHCRVNVGSKFLPPSEDTGMNRVWESDGVYLFRDAPLLQSISANASVNYYKIQAYTAPDIVYRTARSLGVSEKNMTWRVILERGYKYLVRLHFCEIGSLVKKPGDRLMIISMNNEIVDEGFDIVESSGGQMIPIFKDYIVTGAEKENSDYYQLSMSLKPNASSVYDDVILNGLEVFKLSNSRNELYGENPPSPTPPSPPISSISPPPSPNKRQSSNKKTLIIVICVCAPVLLIVISLLCCGIVTIRRQRKGKYWDSRRQSLICRWLNFCEGKSTSSEASALPAELCRYFSLSEIRVATKNFDDEMVIGKGGFGKVFKGEIDGGEKIAAIQRLSPDSEQGTREFETKIKLLSQLRHIHLISLIGYCYQDREMILVYEYMPKGTLQDHIHGVKKDPLTWIQRLEICIGAARGLNYLHTGAERTVIHRDVKATNILLDQNWTAKVSDFGLSLGMYDNPINTKVVGSWGYLDLEYAISGQLTTKLDVYSFGVVLLEVLSVRKAHNNKLDEDQRHLATWAKRCIQNWTIHEIVDPYLKGQIAPECFNKFVEIAEKCIRDKGNDRPNMDYVIQMLEFALQLQKIADAKKKETDPENEVLYPELVYQPVRYNSMIVIGDSDSSTTGMSAATVESSSFAAWNNSNSSTASGALQHKTAKNLGYV